MLSVKGITKIYGGGKKAVDNISFDVNDGQIVGFIGPNGAGKTTTLKMITGILEADTGEISIHGFDIKKDPLNAKRAFGFVPDSPDIFLRLKGIEYLNFMADIYNVPAQERRERIETHAAQFEMTDALNNKIISYSHGMRQKIVLIGALMHKPHVWILDEPLTGLDPKSAYLLKEMMQQHVKEGKTVLFSTHVLEVAEKLCDIVIIINAGKILFNGELEQLKQKYRTGANDSLEEIFLRITGADTPMGSPNATGSSNAPGSSNGANGKAVV